MKLWKWQLITPSGDFFVESMPVVMNKLSELSPKCSLQMQHLRVQVTLLRFNFEQDFSLAEWRPTDMNFKITMILRLVSGQPN